MRAATIGAGAESIREASFKRPRLAVLPLKSERRCRLRSLRANHNGAVILDYRIETARGISVDSDFLVQSEAAMTNVLSAHRPPAGASPLARDRLGLALRMRMTLATAA